MKKKYCNFEYEIHEGCDEGNFYLRGNLISITKEPMFEVVEHDLKVFDKILDHKDSESGTNYGNIDKLIQEQEGYSISTKFFKEV